MRIRYIEKCLEVAGKTTSTVDGGRGRLPALVEEPKSSNSQHQDSNGQTKPANARRILVVENELISAHSLSKLLQLMGNEVQTAYDGLAGIEATERFRPDVVLLDIGMPKLNGYEACRRIRGENWGKESMLIALTGWNDEETQRRTKEAGFDALIHKPVDVSALIKLLGELQSAQNHAVSAENGRQV